MKKGIIPVMAVFVLAIGSIALINPFVDTDKPDNADSTLNLSSVEPKEKGDDGIGFTGYVILEVYDKHGNLKYYNEDHNLVVTKGIESAIDLLFGTTHTTGESVAGFSHIQFGTGATAPATGNTDCQTPAGSKNDDTAPVNTSNGVILNSTSWAIAAQIADGASISEICLTDSNTNATGNMFARQTFTPFTFNTGDLINATWTITGADDGV